MTVSSTYTPITYSGNGSTTAFPVTWPFFTGTLIVTSVSSSGVETTKTLTTDYTVSGGTDSSGLPATGTVTFLTAPASGTTIRIQRTTPKVQASTWAENDPFPQKTVEAMADRLMLIAQENAGGGAASDNVTGDVMTLDSSGATDFWDAEDQIIRNVADGVEDDDAVTKAQLDEAVFGGSLFTHSPAFAVGRTWQSKLRDFPPSILDVIPTAYHSGIADGTNTTDLTDYIQDALDLGIRLTMPRGIYKVTSALKFSRGSQLIGENSLPFVQRLSNISTLLTAQKATIIRYEGSGGSGSAVINISAENVGTKPAYISTEATNLVNWALVGIAIDAGYGHATPAHVGVYLARAGLGGWLDKVLVLGSKRRGFFIGECWTQEFGSLMAIMNYGTGFSIGEDFYGTWTNNINNALNFQTLQCYKNGIDKGYDETSDPIEGIGAYLGTWQTVRFGNLICELNDGAGVYVKPQGSTPLFDNIYVENNCRWDVATDSVDGAGSALSEGRATLPWGFVGHGRNSKGPVIVRGLYGNGTGAQSVLLTADNAPPYIETENPWIFEGLYNIGSIDAYFNNWALYYADEQPTIARCLPTAGNVNSVTSGITTLYCAHAVTGDGSGRDASNYATLEEAIAAWRICSDITTIDVSGMSGTGNGAARVLDGGNIDRPLTLSAGGTGRFNQSTTSAGALFLRDFRNLTLDGFPVIERTEIQSSNVKIKDTSLRLGSDSTDGTALLIDASNVTISGTSAISGSLSSATTKKGIGIIRGSTVTFQDPSASTLVNWTTGYNIEFSDGGGTVYISGSTGLATWANPTAVTRSATASSSIISATNGIFNSSHGWQVLAQSATSITRNSDNATDTSESTLATVTVPAYRMGPNGRVRITTVWSVTNSATSKITRIRFGGTSGTLYHSTGQTTTASLRTMTEIANRNSASSQVGMSTSATGGFGTSTGAVVTSSVATTSAADIVFRAVWGANVAGESITLESYLVEILYGE